MSVFEIMSIMDRVMAPLAPALELASVGAKVASLGTAGNALAGLDTVGTRLAGLDTVGSALAGLDTVGSTLAGLDTVGSTLAGLDTVGKLANALSPAAHAAIFGWSSPSRSSTARDDVAAPSQARLPPFGYADPSKPPPALASPEAAPVQPSTEAGAHAALELSPVAVPSEETRPAEPEAARDIQCPTDDVAGPATALDFSSWPDVLRVLALEEGPERALAIANDIGGKHVTLPKKPRPGHALAMWLGAAYGRVRAALLALGRAKRARVYIPRPWGGDAVIRKFPVMDLLDAGWTDASKIARAAGVGVRYVQQIQRARRLN